MDPPEILYIFYKFIKFLNFIGNKMAKVIGIDLGTNSYGEKRSQP